MGDKDLEFWDDDEWKAFIENWPPELKQYIGSRLRAVQHGDVPATGVKSLQDFKITLYEIKHPSGARVVYTTEYATLTDCVYVLDAFMKDSKEGNKMRKSDKKRIEGRVKAIKERMKTQEDAARDKKRKLH